MRTAFSIPLAFAFTISCAGALGQQPGQMLEQLKSEFHHQGTLIFNRATSQGQFRGCELVFTYAYRDYRNRHGELVAVNGSVFNPYFPGKTFGVFLKVKTADIDMSRGAAIRKDFQPAFASLVLGESIEQFKKAERRCEGGGICKVYADTSGLPLMNIFFHDLLEKSGPSVVLTIEKNGLDETFVLGDIGRKGPDAKSNATNYQSFTKCVGEIPARMSKDLEKRPH